MSARQIAFFFLLALSHFAFGEKAYVMSYFNDIPEGGRRGEAAGLRLKDEETRAKEDGASGYLPKSLDGQALVKFIRRIAKSSMFVTNDYEQNTGILSDKELTVLQYASEGKTRDEIAMILGLLRA